MSVTPTSHCPPSPLTPRFYTLDILDCTEISQHNSSFMQPTSLLVLLLLLQIVSHFCLTKRVPVHIWDPASMSPLSSRMFTTSSSFIFIPFVASTACIHPVLTIFIIFIVIVYGNASPPKLGAFQQQRPFKMPLYIQCLVQILSGVNVHLLNKWMYEWIKHKKVTLHLELVGPVITGLNL